MFNKDVLDLLSESASNLRRNSLFEAADNDRDDADEGEIVFIDTDTPNDMNDELDDIPDLAEDIMYTEETVNVFETRINRANGYVIELDNLSKFAESANMGVADAFLAVCEHYDINKADTYLLIEGKCKTKEATAATEEACKSKKKEVSKPAKKKMAKAKKGLKDLKDKGIKIVKKKDKEDDK